MTTRPACSCWPRPWLWPVTGCGEALLDAVGLPPRVLADGLVAHWTLDEGGGTIASDTSGNGHDGQLTGGTWISDAQFGGGLRLAAGDAVAVPGFPRCDAELERLAVDTDVQRADGVQQQRYLHLDTQHREPDSRAGGEINIDKRFTQPRFVFSYWSPPLMEYIGTECSCVDTGVWVHLAATVDVNTDRITLYRNGTVADQETRPSDIVLGDSTLYFGRWNMDGPLASTATSMTSPSGNAR